MMNAMPNFQTDQMRRDLRSESVYEQRWWRGTKKKKKLQRHSAKYIKALELQVTDNQLQLWIHSVVELFPSVLLL